MKKHSLHLLGLAGTLLASASLFAQNPPGGPGNPGGPNAGNPNPAGIVPGSGRPGGDTAAPTTSSGATPPATGTTMTPPAPTTGATTTPPAATTGNTTVTRPTTPPTGTNPPASGSTPTTPPAGTGTTVTPPTGTTGGTTGSGSAGNTTITPKPTTPPTGTTPTAGTTPPAGATPPAALPPRPNENASDRAKEVTALVQQFDANRDKAMAERAELMKKLDAAKTEAEKQAILTQLRTETQAERDEQAKLGKQIREQLKGAGRRPGG